MLQKSLSMYTMHYTYVGIRRQGNRVNQGDDIVSPCFSDWCRDGIIHLHDPQLTIWSLLFDKRMSDNT